MPGKDNGCHLPMTRRDLLLAGASSAVAVATSVEAATPSTPLERASVPTAQVTLDVNGTPHALDARHAHHAARRAARAPAADRHEEGLRPRPVRRLHGDRRRPAHQLLPDARGDARGRRRSPPSRGSARPSSLHPMQAAFVKHDGYQCGYCTPGQICSAVAVLDEIKAGIPSHVTRRPDRARRSSTADELRERMSGNICRCGAYSNIVEAITEVAGRHGMKPFTYERAQLAGRSRRGRRAQPGREVHRRRHQPARPDEAADRDADAPDRRQRPRRSTGSSRRRTAACASARWCATPTSPPTSACGATTACCRARCSPAPRASCATRRRPPATCCSARAARISTTPTSPATSASPAAAARRSAASAASSR